MQVYLNSITGVPDAITALHMSKRTWTKDLEDHIRDACAYAFTANGMLDDDAMAEDVIEVNKWIDKLVKWGKMHPTLLRFIDLSVTVEGLHRAGQDDWDSHAKRFDNRIIRSSTRLAKYNDNEMSDYYRGKIIPTDAALAMLGIKKPDKIEVDGVTYIPTVNGYIREDMQDNKDVRRGLYMLSIPSNFIFKINLAEWCHVFRERNAAGTANPEVKECCEAIADQIEAFIPKFNRELFQTANTK